VRALWLFPQVWGAYSVIVPAEVAPGLGGIFFEAGLDAAGSSVNFTTFPLQW
jgi:hypothetical protein